MGQFGAWTADVYFDDVRVPAEALVGGEEGLNRASARRCGAWRTGGCTSRRCASAWPSAWSTSRSRTRSTRKQGGQPIGSFQLVQGLIADSHDRLLRRAAPSSWRRPAAYDAGDDTKIGPSCAKYFASEMVGRVADRAVQIHGGAGYMRGVAVERFYRDARLFRIYEGTSQIQQVIIAKALLGEAARG